MATTGSGRRGGTLRVKNKNPSEVQITAEQLLREARESQKPDEPRPPCRGIADAEELSEYRLRKRQEFEALVRRRAGAGASYAWARYAAWEESQRDMPRARSVFERALLDAAARRDHALWAGYAEFEARNGRLGRARAVLDRAVAALPSADDLWRKRAQTEEALGCVAGARVVFERWTARMPCAAAWEAYADLEVRHGEVARARAVYKRLVLEHPGADAFLRYAEFESRHGEASAARAVYERAVGTVDLTEDDAAERLLLSFAGFEENCQAHDRARAVYGLGLERLPESSADELHRRFIAFLRRFGHPAEIEDAVTAKRRAQYEAAVAADPLCYDAWFDLIKLEERTGNKDRVRAVYERAVANVPPAAAEEKRHWRRYIYLWLMRALYEELDARDTDKARAAYAACLRLVPHRKFSSELWIMAAQLEIRHKDLPAARRVLGNAIGLAPKDKIFAKYIDMELRLGNVDRCRVLYRKYVEWAPASRRAWMGYVEMEKSLGEDDRARAIYQLAMDQLPAVDVQGAFPRKEEDVLVEQSNVTAKRKRPDLKILEAAYQWKLQKRVHEANPSFFVC
ncbi:hypothetical protein EJB05_54281, partial [Eragrostis curvula]